VKNPEISQIDRQSKVKEQKTSKDVAMNWRKTCKTKAKKSNFSKEV
jgi:hypothetical protein